MILSEVVLSIAGTATIGLPERIVMFTQSRNNEADLYNPLTWVCGKRCIPPLWAGAKCIPKSVHVGVWQVSEFCGHQILLVSESYALVILLDGEVEDEKISGRKIVPCCRIDWRVASFGSRFWSWAGNNIVQEALFTR